MPKTRKMTEEDKGKILALNDQKLSLREIAVIVGFGKSSVADFIKKYKDTGSTKRKIGSGRPKKTTPAVDRLIKRMCLEDRFKTACDIRKELKECHGIELDVSTVRRRLISEGLMGRRPAKKPLLTAIMRKKRLEWAKNHENWTEEQWQNVIFSDESKFNLFGSDGINYVRRKSGERLSGQCILPTIRKSASRMVWGCFSYHGIKALTLIEGCLNGTGYVEILKAHLLPCIEEHFQFSQRVIFQDDSAPCHRSKIVKIYKTEAGIISLDWPGNSPDLNPIENLWAIIKKQVAQKKPTSLKDLENLIEDTWNERISDETIRTLVASMPNRIKEVIKAKGGSTKY